MQYYEIPLENIISQTSEITTCLSCIAAVTCLNVSIVVVEIEVENVRLREVK